MRLYLSSNHFLFGEYYTMENHIDDSLELFGNERYSEAK